jgi:lipopolysaccharide/colanic/teichoic acid biosynthesis glycosyltransferase
LETQEYRRGISPQLQTAIPVEIRKGAAGTVPGFSGRHPAHRNWIYIQSNHSPDRSSHATAAPSKKRVFRRGFDAFCAAAGLVLLSPIFAVIALAIKLDDGGPVFYSQIRIGQRLRKFQFLKFRSMIFSPAEGSPVTAPRDVRVTRVGRFLRKFKLDELPQLVNVLKGEMQLVGVRPQLEKHVEIFRAEYEELLQSPPGITDLATLTFRNEERFFHEGSIEEQYVKKIMPLKLQIALKYSRTRTFRSDLEIIFRTVLGLEAPASAWGDSKFGPALQSLSKVVSGNHS